MKKRGRVVVKFFRQYWPEVCSCARQTAELWIAVVRLAGELAGELREAEAGQGEAGDNDSSVG